MKKTTTKSASQPQIASESFRFLVVDDSTFSRMNLRGLLEENGHQVIGEAQDGDQAVTLYKETKPDLVTMDLNMPQKTGIEAIKEILAFDPKARFIIITAVDQKLISDDSATMGTTEYVGKPVEWKKLRPAIQRIIKRSHP